MHKNFLLSFLCFVSICFNCEGSLPSYNSHIIFIFGTSCAGKSSLSKQLQQELGSQWKLIDRDDIIEVRQQTYLQVHPHISNETRQKKFEEIERYADESVTLWSHEPCDVIINSEHQSIEEAVQHLVSSFSL